MVRARPQNKAFGGQIVLAQGSRLGRPDLGARILNPIAVFDSMGLGLAAPGFRLGRAASATVAKGTAAGSKGCPKKGLFYQLN